MSDRRKRQLPLVKCEDGVERYTRDNEDGVMRWDEREGARRMFDRYHDQFLRDTLSGGVDVTLVEQGMAREMLLLRESIASLRAKLAAVCEAGDNAVEWTVCLADPNRCCVVDECKCAACAHVNAWYAAIAAARKLL